MKQVYGIGEGMTREEAIEKIEGMNKEKIYGIIDDRKKIQADKHYKDKRPQPEKTMQD